ncbi:hypothetical protein [Comamonas terrigena]|uniref:hypothetical protein n=1 Tax=Comamonas terrigena TaxID=32013 RepID=UPI00289B1981|nr:hypothetical protein [Comamonas terrigena]
MPTDAKAIATWERASHAYSHYQSYLAAQTQRHSLSFTDLVYVKNFKGGSTVIGEPIESLPAKLSRYSDSLARLGRTQDFAQTLPSLSSEAYARVKNEIIGFVGLATDASTKISGFGVSFSSALLHFHFPALVPILDRRALNGAGIKGIKTDSQGQVKDLISFYPQLLDYSRQKLRDNPALSMRTLDRSLFIEALASEVFRK